MLLEDRRYEELKANFKATQSTLSLSLPIEILKHAATIYTLTIFRMFEKELGKTYDCGMNIHSEIETMIEYKITRDGKHFHHIVKYNCSNEMVTSSCKKFDFPKILCSHILKVSYLLNKF